MRLPIIFFVFKEKINVNPYLWILNWRIFQSLTKVLTPADAKTLLRDSDAELGKHEKNDPTTFDKP